MKSRRPASRALPLAGRTDVMVEIDFAEHLIGPGQRRLPQHQ
ncbi:hypothetical protein ACIRSU_35850 [Streptomyces sp. NPDC101160]